MTDRGYRNDNYSYHKTRWNSAAEAHIELGKWINEPANKRLIIEAEKAYGNHQDSRRGIENQYLAETAGINHGIRIGMGSSQEEAKRATECGYWSMYRFNPELKEAGQNPFKLESTKEPKADFKEFLMGEVRYSSLAKAFPEAADALFEKTKKDAMERLAGYIKLDEAK